MELVSWQVFDLPLNSGENIFSIEAKFSWQTQKAG
jgi:hypothetical protein